MTDRVNSDWLRRMHGIRLGDRPADEPWEQAGAGDRTTPGHSPAVDPAPLRDAVVGDRGNVPGEHAGSGKPGPAGRTAKGTPPDGKQEGQGDGIDIEALRAKIKVTEIENIKFDDIKGQDGAVIEIKEIADMLRYEDIYKYTGAQMPRGILLYGPPGTGKTMMATALANSAQAAFLSVDCADLMSKWLGNPEKNAEAVFDIAEQEADAHPSGHCILFLDEVEALLRSRDQDSHEASERVLSIFLQRMNGLAKSGKVTIVAATNRPDKLDAAVISRMNAVIEVPLPDEAGRAAILEARLRKCEERANEAFPGQEISFIGQVDYVGIASLMVTPSGENVLSGRELDNLANELASNRAEEMVRRYKAYEKAKGLATDDEGIGKKEIDLDKVRELGAELGPIDTRVVLETAIKFSKTGYVFDHDVSVDEYMDRIAARKAKDQAASAAAPSAPPPPAAQTTERYGLAPMTREEALRDMFDCLDVRIRSGNETVLRELYVENEAMPGQVRSLVATLIGRRLSTDDALALLKNLRADSSIEPPQVPVWKKSQAVEDAPVDKLPPLPAPAEDGPAAQPPAQ